MARINPTTGQCCTGVTQVVAVDGVTPSGLIGSTALGPSWFNDHTLVYVQNTSTLPFLQYYDLDTDTMSAADTVGHGGANELRANGELWAAYKSVGGTRTSIGLILPSSSITDVEPDGSFMVVQSVILSQGLVIYDNAGTILQNFSVTLTNSGAHYRSDTVSYKDAAGWHLLNATTGAVIPFAPQTGDVLEIWPVDVDGTLWIAEFGVLGLTVRKPTSNLAYPIAPADPNPFYIDARSFQAGKIRLAWSSGAGEANTSLRTADLTLDTGGFTSGTTASGSLVLTAEDPVTMQTIAVGASTNSALLTVLNTPITQMREPKAGWLTPQWVKAFNDLFKWAAAPFNFSFGGTGILPPANGGTGTNTGLSELDADNLTSGTVPVGRLGNVEQVGYWSPLCAGTDYNFAELVAQCGYWSPLMTGPDAATSELVLTAEGDTVSVWTELVSGPMMPPIQTDGDGATIATWNPTAEVSG